MSKKHTSLSRNFLLVVPILALVGIGVFLQSTRRISNPIACGAEDFTGFVNTSEKQAIFETKRMVVPETLLAEGKTPPVLGVANASERWIEVDLSEQKLRAWEGSNLFLETAISSGLPWWPTPQGEFRVWVKLRAAKMEGGQGKHYYFLPNVPFIMYFENENLPGWRGYSLHGTYWHNAFGTPRSHGCVNLPTSIAEKLYYWVTPVLPDGKASVFASPTNTGTRIVIHE